MTLNTGAYTAEILRGGIQGVPHGEIEAARACGMSYALMVRRVILPRAIRIARPAYCNEVILLLKGSALVSTIFADTFMSGFNAGPAQPAWSYGIAV